MTQKAKYKTKQMTELLDFFQTVKGKHFTANDIYEHFERKGKHPSLATIYRHLDRFLEEGSLAKYVIDGTSSACFEYLGDDHHESRMVCYHLKCEKCGKLIHMQCHEVEMLTDHMLEHHDFEIDTHRTVFYGICKECRDAESEIE